MEEGGDESKPYYGPLKRMVLQRTIPGIPVRL
jgi:hypothetical protein